MRNTNTLRQAAATSRTKADASVRWFGSLSRQGVLAAERATQSPVSRTGIRYSLSLVSGSVFIGLGVSFFVHSKLGVPAYDVLYTAMRDQLGLSLGQASWIVGAVFVGASTMLGHRPTINGLLFIFAIGASVDIAVVLVRDATSLPIQWLFVVIGTGAIATGVALVLHAGLTGGPMELLMKAAADRGVDPFKMRISIEAIIVLLGVALGGDAGPGTIFFVVALSPTIRFMQQALVDHQSGRINRLESRPNPLELQTKELQDACTSGPVGFPS